MRVKSSLKIMSLLFLMWVGGVCRKTFLLREESIGRESFLLREGDDRCTMTRYSFLVANHFYCGRETIGVPWLVLIFWYDDRCTYLYCRRITIGVILLSVMNHIFFIAGGERLVYRDSILSRIIFFLQEANDWCTGTQIYHESHFCCGRQKIGVPGLNSIMNLLFFYCWRQTIGLPELNYFWMFAF